jgi:cell division septum initiation protein DivIVA
MSLKPNRTDDKKDITAENDTMARDLRWCIEEALDKFEKEIADYAEWTIDDLTDLRQRVADLEEEAESKDERIENLEAELAEALESAE